MWDWSKGAVARHSTGPCYMPRLLLLNVNVHGARGKRHSPVRGLIESDISAPGDAPVSEAKRPGVRRVIVGWQM